MSLETDPENLSRPEKRASTPDPGFECCAFDKESWSYVQHKDYELHLVQKVNAACAHRPAVPATGLERLAFYRAYTTSPAKLQIIYLHQVMYCSFFWMHAWNVLLKSFPSNYIHTFLGVYNPDEHLFGSKMIPICYGTSCQVILCSLIQLVFMADITTIFMLYAFNCLITTNLFSNCKNTHDSLVPQLKFRCYDIEEFSNLTKKYKFGSKNDYSVFLDYYRWSDATYEAIRKNPDPLVDSEYQYFQVAPMVFFMKAWMGTSFVHYKVYSHIALYVILWTSAALFCGKLYKKYMFVILTNIQWVNNIVYVTSFIYIVWDQIEKEFTNPVEAKQYLPEQSIGAGFVRDIDFDMSADSITGPPVVQFLTARSVDQVAPGRESFLMTSSNFLMYFFLSIINYKLKIYVESSTNAVIHASYLNPFPIFYLWPMFFYEAFMGAFMLRIFYISCFIMEFLVFVITYQIVIELVFNECRWAHKRWIPTLLLSLTGFACDVGLGHMTKMFLYRYTTSITSASEAILICWLYPGGRLFDDAHFLYGTRLKKWRQLSIKMLPFYYFGWRVLFRPVPRWGPRERVIRQLRKKFDSREYVGSQASRPLSRHLLVNAQTATYRLNIFYDKMAAHSEKSVAEDTSGAKKR